MANDLGTVPRLRKDERRRQILLELRLRPHVRISDLSERFRVSTETIRRDVEGLSADGLIDRAHGGASARAAVRYPTFDERAGAQVSERARIGRRAAALVQPGETLMVDSGSTTLQFARHLAFAETPCTVITNGFAVAMALGQAEGIEVVVCPGDYLGSEAAAIGTETVAFLARHRVDRCMIGASGLTADGPSEAIRGFAAVKRAMLEGARAAHLLVDRGKFGHEGLSRVAPLSRLTSVVCDRLPDSDLRHAIVMADVDIAVAD
ncbi:DeoR/GlpR transcriptional regulator [Rhodobacteraceae bacterium CCMM004]|nr:DeoR/GlpR transcriptional regulator [Rhodobacteraceae bacterium CCMM004]